MATPREKYTKDGLKRAVTFSIHPDQDEAITDLAIERRSNRSVILREAVDMYLRVNGRDPRLQPRSEQTVAVA